MEDIVASNTPMKNYKKEILESIKEIISAILYGERARIYVNRVYEKFALVELSADIVSATLSFKGDKKTLLGIQSQSMSMRVRKTIVICLVI